MKHERWMRLQRESEALQAWARQPIPIPIMYRAHDPILHTNEQPFCDNPDCPCHGDPETFQLVDQPYKDGLLTSQEAERLFLGSQIRDLTASEQEQLVAYQAREVS